jgi:hypothetical protein
MLAAIKRQIDREHDEYGKIADKMNRDLLLPVGEIAHRECHAAILWATNSLVMTIEPVQNMRISMSKMFDMATVERKSA